MTGPEGGAPGAVTIRGLRVELSNTGRDIVDHIDIDLVPGEVLGLVGESGSGKTTAASALLGYARRGTRIAAGSVLVGTTDVVGASASDLQRLRGRVVAYVPQDPATALNPSLRIRTQLRELIDVHDPSCSAQERDARIAAVLADVHLPTDEGFLARFPHQLSGGQQQRVCLAMAFVLEPGVIVFDEPTTGLDVTTQAAILDTIRRLCTRHRTAAIYVSHDLAVVGEIAHRVAVLYAGRLVEVGPTADLLGAGVHPYTGLLAAAIPDVAERRTLRPIPGQAPSPNQRPDGCNFAPRCPLVIDRCRAEAPALVQIRTATGGERQVACHRSGDAPMLHTATAPPARRAPGGAPVLTITGLEAGYRSQRVLEGIDLTLHAGECLALVGESGSGKTTLARAVIGLVNPTAGSISLQGKPLAATARARTAGQRQAIQYVFQNPYASVNPRRRIGQTLTTVLRHFHPGERADAPRRIRDALTAVSLPPGVADAYPDQLSGGERQRVAIARALLCEPVVMLCDEITSALDVSVQAAIVQLLAELQAERNLALAFVTHDLALVRSVADRVAVMSGGRIVEQGPVDDVLDHPTHDYTAQLLDKTPRPAGPRTEH